jgi:hypothetical protein
MHLKNLNLMSKKLSIMSNEIDKDLSLNGNDEYETNSESGSSDEGEDCEDEEIIDVPIKEKKRERVPRKKTFPSSPKINGFLKKKQTENDLMSNEDKDYFSLNAESKLLENVGLAIEEKGKKKKKTKTSS